ncbi:hypothetical protein GGR56DRAFT_387926 [Xylariaceae sp. FL0804]|nr:hypothetical protein GGR56DRAFT_387926 [Xylariaceae sp. FL0804]
MPISLLSLPPEIFGAICDALVPPPHPIGTHIRRGSFPEETSWRGLWDLCLTSRDCRAFATPRLYRNVAIPDGEALVLLFRSMILNPTLRSFIKSLACLVSGTETWVRDAAFKCWNEHVVPAIRGLDIPASDRRILDYLGIHLVRLPATDKEIEEHELDRTWYLSMVHMDLPLGTHILGGIICLAHEVEDLLIQPDDIRLDPNEDESAYLGEYLDLVVFALTDPSDFSKKNLLPQILRHLKVFRTRMNPFELAVMGPDGAGPFLEPLSLPYWNVSTLRSIEMYGDSGNWNKLHHPESSPPSRGLFRRGLFRSLRKLCLYRTATSPPSLFRILQAYKGLETLEYTTRPQEWQFSEVASMQDSSINAALLVGRDRLKQLRIGNPVGTRATGEDRDLPEPVTCLRDFTKLAHLSIDLRWIMPPKGMFSIHHVPGEESVDYSTNSLHLFLPASLQVLEIVETWRSDELEQFSKDSTIEARCTSWIGIVLISLFKGMHHTELVWLWLSSHTLPSPNPLRLGFPNLHKVTFKAMRPYHKPDDLCDEWELCDAMRNASSFGPVIYPKSPAFISLFQAIFSSAEVEFCWKWPEQE